MITEKVIVARVNDNGTVRWVVWPRGENAENRGWRGKSHKGEGLQKFLHRVGKGAIKSYTRIGERGEVLRWSEAAASVVFFAKDIRQELWP